MLHSIKVSIFLLLTNVLTVIGQCPVEIEEVKHADDWDNTFIQSSAGTGLLPEGRAGWVGGDSTYSLLLPNGNTAFFFSDSYIAESPKTMGDGTVTVSETGLRTMQPNCPPPYCDVPAAVFTARNSIVIRDRSGRQLTTLVGPKNEHGLSTSYFPEPEKGLYYWLGDAAIVQTRRGVDKSIVVYLHKFDSKMAYHGASVAFLDVDGLQIKKVIDLTGEKDKKIHWGTSIHTERDRGKEFLYIYGKGTFENRKQTFLARTEIAKGTEYFSDIKRWQIWDGKKWKKDVSKAAAITPASDSVSDEFSIRAFEINGKNVYLMSSLDTSEHIREWDQLTLYTSCKPEGPFANRRNIYKTPETGSLKVPGMAEGERLTSGIVMYNPHIHTQFTEGSKILISYNTNTSHISDTVFIDTYRPRFIWVNINGLK